ncbi:MAG: hypothetical protein ACREL7_02460 [Longimicrobiales bacterium]
MHRMTKKFTIAFALALTAAGCDTGPTAPDAGAAIATDEFAAFDIAATFDAASLDRDVPSWWETLAAEIPGFAGIYIDRACNIHVMLVDLSQAGKATELLSPVLRRLLNARPDCPNTATILVHQADYTWVQLKTFLAKLRPLSQVRGILRLGISIQQNRIVVVIASRSVHPAAVEAIEALDVPLAAVVFRVHPPTNDRRRP